jgi:predicted acyltransferase
MSESGVPKVSAEVVATTGDPASGAASARPATQAPATQAPATQAPPTRLLSLDIFRGITIAGMLLVNNPGSWSTIYPPLRHAAWHGWTPTDLIFPFFLFIVGVALTFSLGKALAQGASRRTVLVRAARRAALLFALGLVLHSYPWYGYDLAQLRIPGVLQRIALAFILAVPLQIWGGVRARVGAAVTLLLGYWAAMSWIPVPGVGAGVWEPGQDLGAYLDRLVFGTEHLWKQSVTWDPEGLLSTLPAVATVLLGTFAGDWLRSSRSGGEKVLGLLAAGGAGIALGLAWDQVFPINKPLWTSSYVVFTGGMALATFGLCYWLADLKGYRRWGFPFQLFGVNAIAAFFLSSLGARVITQIPVGETTLKGWVYATIFVPGLSPANASLGFALSYTLFWLGVMGVLYWRRIFIKV